MTEDLRGGACVSCKALDFEASEQWAEVCKDCAEWRALEHRLKDGPRRRREIEFSRKMVVAVVVSLVLGNATLEVSYYASFATVGAVLLGAWFWPRMKDHCRACRGQVVATDEGLCPDCGLSMVFFLSREADHVKKETLGKDAVFSACMRCGQLHYRPYFRCPAMCFDCAEKLLSKHWRQLKEASIIPKRSFWRAVFLVGILVLSLALVQMVQFALVLLLAVAGFGSVIFIYDRKYQCQACGEHMWQDDHGLCRNCKLPWNWQANDNAMTRE